MIIRDGTFDDFQYVLPLAHEVHAFSPPPFCDIPIVDSEIQRTWVVNIVNPDGFVKVAEKDGEVVGCLVAMAFMNHWGIKVAQDLFCMAHGGTRKLLEEYKIWAKTRGAAMIIVTDICGQPGYREMIESVGFAATGTNLIGVD